MAKNKARKTESVEVKTEPPVAVAPEVTLAETPPANAAGAATKDGLEKLKKAEVEELEKQEKVLAKDQVGYWESAKALTVIHDRKLYRASYLTFREYCLERWSFDRAHGNRMLKASVLYENLKCLPLGDIQLPVSEAQVRPLVRVSPDKQEEAWRRALELAGDGRVTMKLAEEAAARFLPAKAEQPAGEDALAQEPAEPADETPAGARTAADEAKALIKRLRELWADCDGEIREALNQIAIHAGLDVDGEDGNQVAGGE